MSKLLLPQGYNSILNPTETQIAIKKIKDFFQRELARALNLGRVSAPLFVQPETGLNDNLSGTERRVDFSIKDMDELRVEVVQSLAKWKRMALGKYNIPSGVGLYTDMNAIRRDEELDNIHSIYVDQWDWEKVIEPSQRSTTYLEEVVKTIYNALLSLEDYVYKHYHQLKPVLPDEIHFITSQDLEDLYPEISSKERESLIAKQYGAVFISQIGGALRSGKPHDLRSPDYDDWMMNGDIIVWDEVLNIPLELSSMGIRVDAEAMDKQLKLDQKDDRRQLKFHQDVLNDRLPYTIGGGIGQSRLCMFFLKKAHIGEVQVSVWPSDMIAKCQANNIFLL